MASRLPEGFAVPVTMRQIARRAGVSAITVSRALAGSELLKPETRDKVLKVAGQLGYRANAAARAMATGRFNTIALLLDAKVSREHLPSNLLYGIQKTLADRGLLLTVAHFSDEQLTDESTVPAILKQVMSDGLLVNYKMGVPQRLIELLERHRIPTIWIESDRPYDCVMVDHAWGAAEATRHLLELGHRQIAFADNHPADLNAELTRGEVHWSLQERREGYAQTMRQAGLVPRFLQVHPSDESRDRLAQARQWLSARDRPTAVVCFLTATALPVMFIAQELGLRVPGELSVITFSDQRESMGIPMSRMRLPDLAIGEVAAQMLLEKIEHPSRRLRSARVRPELDPGQTCSPPASTRRA
jgi:DNA-binding LacI/PurR family transcriptional regulator